MKLTESKLRKIIREEKQKLKDSAPGSQMKMKLDKLKRLHNDLKVDVNPNDLPSRTESKFVQARATLNKGIEELEAALRAYKNERR